MTEVPSLTWPAVILSTTACLSGITLSIQRTLYHERNKTQFGKDPSLMKEDTTRDYTRPFSDSHRLTRIVFDTVFMVLFSINDLYSTASQFSSNRVYALFSTSAILIAWLYCLALTFVSRRYTLPNRWGWALNIHLFVFYSVSLSVSLYRLWQVFQHQHGIISLSQGLPLFFAILFTADLFYTTGSIDQGPPFLDDEGKETADISVASIFSFLYFSWATPLVDRVYNNPNIKDKDLPRLPPIYRSHNIFYIFGQHRSKGLVYRIVKANKKAIFLQSVTTAVAAVLYYLPAFFLNRFLALIQEMDEGNKDEFSTVKGIMIICGLSLSLMLLSLVVGQLYYWSSSSLRVRIKSMLNIEIYHKTLRRMDTADLSRDSNSDQEDNNTSLGMIVNLMSTDSQRISDFTTSWFTIIEAPIELAVGITFLYSLLGTSCLLGLLMIVVTLPLNHYNSMLFARTQEKLMEARDKRVSLMNEVLQGIRQIKFFAWENNWEYRVLEARDEEIKHLRTTYISEVLFNFLWQGTPLLVTVVSFYSFTKLQGQELTASIAFTAITVFNELRSALNSLPETFVDILQALISVRRIESYLDEDEVTPPPTNLDPQAKVKLGFANATISWSYVPMFPEDSVFSNSSLTSLESSEITRFESSDSFVLHNLTADFPNGKLSIICGATGSGKTLMMMSLLRETTLLDGKIFCPRAHVVESLTDELDLDDSISEEDWILDHGVAYVSQTAWLRNATIRDNILFGLPFILERYKDTLYACALDKDLTALEDGDLTQVGEKGITLSGGQKARVALARAVYSRAKNVLIDDCLSAVDAHTARHLLNKCLTGPLMENRTRILITHHVGLCITGASYVIHIENGKINLSGSPDQLETEGKLELIMDEVVNQDHDKEPIEETIEEEIEKNVPELAQNKPPLIIEEKDEKKARVLTKDEGRAVGRVRFKFYWNYVKVVGNPLYWMFVLGFIFGSRLLDVAESWWIKKWVQSNEEALNIPVNVTMGLASIAHRIHYTFKETSTSASLLDPHLPGSVSNTNFFQAFISKGEDSLNMYLTVYILITTSNILIGASRWASLYYGTLRASRKLYQILLHRIMHAPMRFFDVTPLGRILNRFSKDFEYVDSSVPNDIMYFAIQWLIIISAVLTVCAVFPIFFIPMLFVTFLNIQIGKRFSSASRELRRMDSVTRSPLFTHFGETIVGIVTIRAYGATRQFLEEMLRKVDENARPFYLLWIANRWCGTRFSFLGAAVNFCTGCFILSSLDYIDASLAGFCLSFVLSYTSQMTLAIKRFTRLEMSFNSVERIVELMETEQEPPVITDIRPPTNWPTQGKIVVLDLEVKYAPELEPVLRDLTFSIKPSEKVGVVGRTGSGKSTLALSFFRIVEASQGNILIDGIDIQEIGTQDLRSHLTIIPQDPVLFSGTIRSNMDPFGEFTDEDIITALHRVRLIPYDDIMVHSEDLNSNVFTDLSNLVGEGGSNFSQGQRQLVCLARALLKRNKVVLMDEATSSIDFEMDEMIQRTIATEFADCTIICIAHRIKTVVEYDRILVLDQGEIAEFDSPLSLLNQPESIFYKMCENSGEFESLLTLAKQKHQLVDV